MSKVSLKSLSDLIMQRVSNDWDIVIAVTGEEGVGKSTLAILLSMILDKQFSLVDNIAYLPTYEEVQGKFYSLKPKQVFLIDEAIKVLYKLRWSDRFQIELSEMYATERWHNKISILCMPRFTDFNERFRNWRIKVWIHLFGRGHGAVFIKDDTNIYTTDPWYMKENYKLLVQKIKRAKGGGFEEKLALYENAKNFAFFFTFPPLDPATELRYKELKAKARKMQGEKDDRPREMRIKRNNFFHWLYNNALTKKPDGKITAITEQQLADAWGMSSNYMSEIINKVREDKSKSMLT